MASILASSSSQRGYYCQPLHRYLPFLIDVTVIIVRASVLRAGVGAVVAAAVIAATAIALLLVFVQYRTTPLG
tara:strand:+ start:96 stop:314 length:219 start_codon:yes stop_codon:yes gene_type:complete